MKSSAEIGRWGEDVVAERLRAEGFLIAERNWRLGHSEVDIIALKLGCIHFVEVKTRSVSDWNRAEDSITLSKRRALMRAASAYAQTRYPGFDIQFDLASVVYRPDGTFDIDLIECIL